MGEVGSGKNKKCLACSVERSDIYYRTSKITKVLGEGIRIVMKRKEYTYSCLGGEISLKFWVIKWRAEGKGVVRM